MLKNEKFWSFLYNLFWDFPNMLYIIINNFIDN